MSPIKIIQQPQSIIKIESKLQQIILQEIGSFPQPTGQTTIHRAGDDAYIEQNVLTGLRIAGRINPLTDFFTLLNNNPFGVDGKRFTDQSGDQIYADDIVLDWCTRFMWFRTPTAAGSSNWDASIDGAFAASTGGFSDWFLPNVQQLCGIANFSVESVLNYAPFDILVNAVNKRIWTSTTNAGSTSDKWALLNNDSINPNQSKSNLYRYIYCRPFTLADIGL